MSATAQQTSLRRFFQSTSTAVAADRCTTQRMEDHADWLYLPSLCADIDFPQLLKEVRQHAHSYTYTSPAGLSYASKRQSFKLLRQLDGTTMSDDEAPALTMLPDAQARAFNYDQLRTYALEECAVLAAIQQRLEEYFHETYDYSLIHLYRTGEDRIMWHNDKEAWSTPVVSVSFGATRKFRFRALEATTGYHTQYSLRHGDVIYMKRGCQQRWKHEVPVEKRVQQARVNITLRQFE